MNTAFKFLASEIEAPFSFTGPQCLYNLSGYLDARPQLKRQSFYIINTKSGNVEGYIRFQISDEKAYSPYRAPFGSFSLTKNIDFETLTAFISFIEDHFRLHAIKEIIIRHFPYVYDPYTCELVIVSLGSMKFHIECVDIDHFLEVSDLAFPTVIHTMEQRKLRKCEKAGFIFNHHANTEAGSVFRYIELFRKTRNIPVNIDWNTLQNLMSRFPDKYDFFSVMDGADPIAATICIDVNQKVLYNFLPASNEAYKTFSPMVYLMERIYVYAQNSGFRYIDLGISSIRGEPQSGLIKFKERLGGVPMGKFTFKKII